jgi:hypothetical protein
VDFHAVEPRVACEPGGTDERGADLTDVLAVIASGTRNGPDPRYIASCSPRGRTAEGLPGGGGVRVALGLAAGVHQWGDELRRGSMDALDEWLPRSGLRGIGDARLEELPLAGVLVDVEPLGISRPKPPSAKTR